MGMVGTLWFRIVDGRARSGSSPSGRRTRAG
jgi:hypothetical protein